MFPVMGEFDKKSMLILSVEKIDDDVFAAIILMQVLQAISPDSFFAVKMMDDSEFENSEKDAKLHSQILSNLVKLSATEMSMFN